MKILFIFLSIFWTVTFADLQENTAGVAYKFHTSKLQIALTFDACGGKVTKFDEKLFGVLSDQNVSATIFVSSSWVDSNLETFAKISSNGNFEIGNHGTFHKPLSVDGKEIYGISGTKNQDEVVNEVFINQQKIENLTHKKPIFFRSGTATYDKEAVKIAKNLGVLIAGFSINGDSGATLGADEIFERLKYAKKGDIVIAHINKPKSQNAEGFLRAIKFLKSKGFEFVKLSDIKNQLIEY